MTIVESLPERPLLDSTFDDITWDEHFDLVVPGPTWVRPDDTQVVYRFDVVLGNTGYGLAFVDDHWELLTGPVPGPEAKTDRIDAIDAIHDRLEERVEIPDDLVLRVVWSTERVFGSE